VIGDNEVSCRAASKMMKNNELESAKRSLQEMEKGCFEYSKELATFVVKILKTPKKYMSSG